jgi:hypothetical protein
MAKHGNPMMQKTLASRKNGEFAEHFNGPDTSDSAARLIQIAFQYAGSMAQVAAVWSTYALLPESYQEEIKPVLDQFAVLQTEYDKFVVDQGWNETPAPGRWGLTKK